MVRHILDATVHSSIESPYLSKAFFFKNKRINTVISDYGSLLYFFYLKIYLTEGVKTRGLFE